MEARLVTTFRGHKDSVESVCFTENETVISIDRKGNLFTWDRINQKPRITLRVYLSPALTELALSDGTVLFGGYGEKIYHFKNEEKPENIFPFDQRLRSFICILFMKEIENGKIILYDSESYSIIIFNYFTKKIEKMTKVQQRGYVDRSYFGCDYKNGLVAVSSDESVDFYDSKKLEIIFSIESTDIGKIKFLANELIAFASMRTNTIEIWNLNNKKLEKKLVGHKDVLDFLEIQDGILLSAGGDKMIRIWDVQLGISLGRLEGHKWAVNKLISMNNFMIISASDDETIKMWQLKIQTSNHLNLIKKSKLFDINFLFRYHY
eukprot:gene12751-7027_t